MHRSNQIHSLFADWERVLCFSDRPSLSRKSGRKKHGGWVGATFKVYWYRYFVSRCCSVPWMQKIFVISVRFVPYLMRCSFTSRTSRTGRFDKIPYRRKALSPVVMKWIYSISLKRTTLPQLKPITPIVGLILRLARAVPVEWLQSIIATWTSVRWVVGMPGETLS